MIKKPMLSIILPVCNQKSLLSNVSRVVGEAEKLGMPYEIIIAEDGSTDGSAEEAARLARSNKKITHLHSDERLGKGNAIKRAVLASKGGYIVFMDVDLATNLSALPEMLRALEKNDLVIGSRYLLNSKTSRSLKRLVLSRGFNLLVSLATGVWVSDFQCGFKGFRREFIMKVIGDIEDGGWLWDTELIVLARKRGFRLAEIPVRWEEKSSSLDIARDSIGMGCGILKLGWRTRTARMH